MQRIDIPLIYFPWLSFNTGFGYSSVRIRLPRWISDNDWIFPIYLNLPLPTFRHSWQIRGKLFPFHLDLAPDVFTSRWFLAISYFRPGCPRLIVLSFARASTLTRIPGGAASSFASMRSIYFCVNFPQKWKPVCHVGLEKVRNAIVGTSLLCNTLLLLVIHTTATDTAENSNHYWVLFLPL